MTRFTRTHAMLATFGILAGAATLFAAAPRAATSTAAQDCQCCPCDQCPCPEPCRPCDASGACSEASAPACQASCQGRSACAAR